MVCFGTNAFTWNVGLTELEVIRPVLVTIMPLKTSPLKTSSLPCTGIFMFAFSMEPSYQSLFINPDHAKVIKTGPVYFQIGQTN